jgi:hypothetical protein
VGIGIGIAVYVAAYILAHDGIAHGRFWVPPVLRRLPLFRVVTETHYLHHRGGRDGVGASPFGVYLAALEHRWGLSVGYRPPTIICVPRSSSRAATKTV